MTAKIVAGDRVVGVVVVESFEREYAFGPDEIRLLQTIVGEMGVALENARLFDETQRLLRETEQQARDLTESLDYQTAISDVLRVISQSPTDVRRCSRRSSIARHGCSAAPWRRSIATTAAS